MPWQLFRAAGPASAAVTPPSPSPTGSTLRWPSARPEARQRPKPAHRLDRVKTLRCSCRSPERRRTSEARSGRRRFRCPLSDRRTRRVPLMPKFAPKVRFASDSPLEGRVHCELVSELGTDSGRVMDDSGTVKRCFPLEFRRKLSLFALAAGSALRQLSPCDYVRFGDGRRVRR